MTDLTFHATPEQTATLQRVATETGKNVQSLISALIEEWREDMEDIRLAEARLAEGGRLYTLEEVEKECGLDN